MKKMKDIKTEDIEKELVDARETLSSFNFNLSGAKTKDVRVGRNTRRKIARILTELRLRKS